MHKSLRFSLVLFLALLAALPSQLYAETPFETSIDHAATTDKAVTRSFERKAGEYLRITMQNTCDAFSATTEIIQATPVKPQKRGLTASPVVERCYLRKARSIEQTVSGGEAGFVVYWRKPAGSKPFEAIRYHPDGLIALRDTCDWGQASGPTDDTIRKWVSQVETEGEPPNGLIELFACPVKSGGEETTKKASESAIEYVPLHDLTIVAMLAPVPPVAIEFAGAFTTSFLTDPVYSLKPKTGSQPATYTIAEDADARDAARLGVAGMIHVFFPRSTSWAGKTVVPTFGLGVSTGGQVDYFLGLSWRAYGQFFLSAGAHLGQIARLPNGLAVNAEVSDANALSNLPKRTTGSFFFALSYAFLNPGQETFTRPFKTAEPKTVGQAPAAP